MRLWWGKAPAPRGAPLPQAEEGDSLHGSPAPSCAIDGMDPALLYWGLTLAASTHPETGPHETPMRAPQQRADSLPPPGRRGPQRRSPGRRL